MEEMRPVAPSMSEAEADPVQVMGELDCIMCETFLEWLHQAWPTDKAEELPVFLARRVVPILKIHSDQQDHMPFCEPCARIFLQAMSLYHRERQAREGQEQTELRARVESQIVAPRKQIVLPGQPGFRT